MNNVQKLLASIRHKLPESGSLYLFGSNLLPDATPNDLDLLWISDETFPVSVLKELHLSLNLKIDLFCLSHTEFFEGLEHPLHPKSLLLRIFHARSLLVSGKELKINAPEISDDDLRVFEQMAANYHMYMFMQSPTNWNFLKVIRNIGMVKYKFPLRTPTKQFDANYLKAHGGELAQIYQEVEKGAMISQDMVAKVTQELELINSDYWSQPHKLSPRWRDLNEAYIRFLLPPEAMHDWNSGQDIWLTRPGEVAKLPK